MNRSLILCWLAITVGASGIARDPEHDLLPVFRPYQAVGCQFEKVGQQKNLEKMSDFGKVLTSRFFVVDRFAEKYPSFTPYQYAASNPLRFLDVNGDSISMLGFKFYDQRFETDLLDTVLDDLQEQTGLILSLDKKGNLVFRTNGNGEPVIQKNDKGKPAGSAEARKLITGAIGYSQTVDINVKAGSGSMAVLGGHNILVDPDQISGFIASTAVDLDPKTLGFGMTFMHELSHTAAGGSLHDDRSEFGATGAVIKRMNLIRRQLGKTFGQRLSYSAKQVVPNGNSYIPFTRSAFEMLKNGQVPIQGTIF